MAFGHLASSLGYVRNVKLGDYWLTANGVAVPIYDGGVSASSGSAIQYMPDPTSQGWRRMTGSPPMHGSIIGNPADYGAVTDVGSASQMPSAYPSSGGSPSIASPSGTAAAQQQGAPMHPPAPSILSNPKLLLGGGLAAAALLVAAMKKKK